MAGLIKILITLVVAAVILGGAAYIANELYFKPKKMDQLEREELARLAAEAAAPPPPDSTVPLFEKLRTTADLPALRSGLEEFLQTHPDSTKAAEARELLGETNANLLFSSQPTPDKESYTVVKGDSLVKIASKYQTSAEMLMRTNNLLTHNLQIGQSLLVPKFTPRIVVNRKTKTLTLLNGGAFFKEYALQAPRLPAAQTTKISDKIAIKDGKRVAFGAKEFVDADRTLMLAPPAGMFIRAEAEPASGLMLPRADLEEIYTLVPIGTPV
ncbi:MAG TPA: LysM peptidoglycan-binding domain-containing protein, partial [Chthoniobacterales bacterium]